MLKYPPVNSHGLLRDFEILHLYSRVRISYNVVKLISRGRQWPNQSLYFRDVLDETAPSMSWIEGTGTLDCPFQQ
jgi:hypothetical protein